MKNILNEDISAKQLFTHAVSFEEGGEIKLTDQEMEMIRIKREQDELKKKELDLKQQEKRSKDIMSSEKAVERYLAEDQQYVKASKDFYEKFEKAYPGQFELVELEDYQKTEELYDHERDDQGKTKEDADGYLIKNVYWSKPYSLKNYEIKYNKDKKYTIKIEAHKTYTTYGSYKGQEWVMKLKGLAGWKDEQKNLKSVKTIKDKIDEDIASKERKVSAEQREKEGLQFMLDYVKEKYKDEKPEVKIEAKGRRDYKNNWVESRYVSAKFLNGLKVDYNYNFKDGAYSAYISDINAYGLNQEETVNALLKVSKKAS